MLEIGEILEGRYRVTAKIGRGGMGVVFAGEHVRVERPIAIKVLRGSVAEEPEMVERFEREARAASRIGSARIVEVYDVGELASGEHYMVMELLEGESLWTRLDQRGRMAPAEIFPIAVQLLEGLEAAHAAGIVHRDLKPANVFLTQRNGEEFVKILDFGISKFREGTSENLTQSGAILGTLRYMAPEQTTDPRNTDHRADVYGVGSILYRAISGRTPYKGDTMPQIIAQLLTEDPPALDTIVDDIDAKTSALVHRALARAPAARYQSAAEFRDTLVEYLAQRSTALIAAAPTEEDAPSSQPQEPAAGGDARSEYLPAGSLSHSEARLSERLPLWAAAAAVMALVALAAPRALLVGEGTVPVALHAQLPEPKLEPAPGEPSDELATPASATPSASAAAIAPEAPPSRIDAAPPAASSHGVAQGDENDRADLRRTLRRQRLQQRYRELPVEERERLRQQRQRDR